MISAIVCVDNNWGIGYNGDLLIKIPEDMRFFKEKTMNEVVIMGRKTYDSLPVKPLPNRTNIVVTSKADEMNRINKNGVMYVTMNFIEAYLQSVPLSKEADYYIIGGGQIYKELLQYCDCVYLTKILESHDNVDTYFPNIDAMSEWQMTDVGELKEYNGIKYKFYTYKKANND